MIWSKPDIEKFLELHAKGVPADGIACGLMRSKAAVQAMRRKLCRLRELGIQRRELLAEYLRLGERQLSDIPAIRRRMAVPGVLVRSFLRRGSVYGRPCLVVSHTRTREGE